MTEKFDSNVSDDVRFELEPVPSFLPSYLVYGKNGVDIRMLESQASDSCSTATMFTNQ